MTQYTVLQKEDFDAFVSGLIENNKLVAPVKRGDKNYAFDLIESPSDITMEYIPTILPPKKYFMPQNEVIAEFCREDEKWETVLYRVDVILFGVHTCDLAGIQSLNIVFSDKPRDYNYLLRKNKITIIGLECTNVCDEYASCKVMDNHLPNGGYDLFITDIGSKYIIHVNTLRGEALIAKTEVIKPAKHEDMTDLEEFRRIKRTTFKNEVKALHGELKPLFDSSFDSPLWEKIGERCVACGNCTNVCPTCYCFTIEDEIELDLSTGHRLRKWDSCQNPSFAMVAGGESFREKRSDRQKHRYMRKFKYPFSKFRRYFCTGCGRCSRTCMAGINLKETINALVDEKGQKDE